MCLIRNLATFRVMGGSLIRRAVCGVNDRGAEHMTDEMMKHIMPLKPELVSIEERPAPEWHMYEPVNSPTGWPGHAARDHLLRGDVIGRNYRGHEYIVLAVLYEGEDTPALGTAFMTCRQFPRRVREIVLDHIGEQHAMDRLDGEIIVFSAEIEAEGAAAIKAA
jgi:hypothetical protein